MRSQADTHRPGDEADDQDEDEPDGAADQTAMKTVSLPNAGGTLTLSGNFNLFELDGHERKLVFGIIDQMKAFEKSGGEDA